MTSSTEDCLNSDLFDGKALETLIIASVRTLKRGNKKCGREEVSKLVNDTLCNETCKDLFNETLDSLIEKQFIKCNIISNRKCLSLPKDSELHHRSIQSTQEDSSVHEHLNSCALLDSETNRKSFPFKEELETFKVQVISEIKNLILKEISVLKEAITTHSNIDVLSGKAQTEEFYQEQLRFINEELRNKDNLINSLLHQLSKQTECITSLNNRFSNNAIDDNNNNNDNLNRKNNSYSNENKNNNNTDDNNDKKIIMKTTTIIKILIAFLPFLTRLINIIVIQIIITISQVIILMITIIALLKIQNLLLFMIIYLITIQITITMTPVIFLKIIVTTIISLAVILIIVIHLIITQIFPIMIPIISTATIIVTRIRIIIRNRIVFLQINIKEILKTELNIKLRNLNIILI